MGVWHSGPRRCRFDGLAAVEVQSIMQMLDDTSLLRLARCSRRMHADADCDVAWQTQPPFAVRLEHGTGVEVAGRFRRSLLWSHLPAMRICPHLSSWKIRRLLKSDIDAMLTLPRILEMNDEWRVIPTSEWRRILHHPAMAGLNTIRIQLMEPRDVISHLAHLPQLHTLELSPRYPDLHASDVAFLPSLPALIGDLDPPMMTALIAACTRFKRLQLNSFRFDQGGFQRLFTSPHLSRLHRLSLAHLDTFRVAEEEFADAFAAMTQLRHLELECISYIDTLLSGAAHTPHLGTVDIISVMPEVATLQLLIDQTEATSRVQVTLRVGHDMDSRRFASIDSHRLTLVPLS